MANTVTSSTATVVAVTTDTVFSATYRLGPRSESGVVYAYFKYTKVANNMSAIFEIINPSLSATDKYKVVFITTDDDIAPLSLALTATGNVRVPIEVGPGDGTLVVTLTYAGTGSTDATAINFTEG